MSLAQLQPQLVPLFYHPQNSVAPVSKFQDKKILSDIKKPHLNMKYKQTTKELIFLKRLMEG